MYTHSIILFQNSNIYVSNLTFSPTSHIEKKNPSVVKNSWNLAWTLDMVGKGWHKNFIWFGKTYCIHCSQMVISPLKYLNIDLRLQWLQVISTNILILNTTWLHFIKPYSSHIISSIHWIAISSILWSLLASFLDSNMVCSIKLQWLTERHIWINIHNYVVNQSTKTH